MKKFLRVIVFVPLLSHFPARVSWNETPPSGDVQCQDILTLPLSIRQKSMLQRLQKAKNRAQLEWELKFDLPALHAPEARAALAEYLQSFTDSRELQQTEKELLQAIDTDPALAQEDLEESKPWLLPVEQSLTDNLNRLHVPAEERKELEADSDYLLKKAELNTFLLAIHFETKGPTADALLKIAKFLEDNSRTSASLNAASRALLNRLSTSTWFDAKDQRFSLQDKIQAINEFRRISLELAGKVGLDTEELDRDFDDLVTKVQRPTEPGSFLRRLLQQRLK